MCLWPSWQFLCCKCADNKSKYKNKSGKENVYRAIPALCEVWGIITCCLNGHNWHLPAIIFLPESDPKQRPLVFLGDHRLLHNALPPKWVVYSKNFWGACWVKVQKIQVRWKRLYFTSNRCYRIVQSTVASENRMSLNYGVNLSHVVFRIPRNQSWNKFIADVHFSSLSSLLLSDNLYYISYILVFILQFWHLYRYFSFWPVPMSWLYAQSLKYLFKINLNIHL